MKIYLMGDTEFQRNLDVYTQLCRTRALHTKNKLESMELFAIADYMEEASRRLVRLKEGEK